MITAANGGQAGIDAFTAAASTADKAFDVVITDLGMPYVDGRKVAAAIKAISRAHAGDHAHRLGPAPDRRERHSAAREPRAQQAAAPARAARGARATLTAVS